MFRTDISVDWYKNPRMITIAAPSTSVSIQDLVDTLRELEDSDYAMAFPFLIKASGKENLGSDVFVGITAELQNAKVTFEPRHGVVESGTVTGKILPSGKILTSLILEDYNALFITSGVKLGDTVINMTDGSNATILSVDSEIQLTTMVLGGGVDNRFDYEDSYKVWPLIQCEINGGNLTAVDEFGASMGAIYPTVGTQITRTSSSSGTIAQLEIDNIQRLIETQRGSHIVTGEIYYWDPVIGSDNNDGMSPSKPVKTFAKVHDLVEDGGHDLIICQPGKEVGQTRADEHLVISKSHLMIRGPGRDFVIYPSTTGFPAVKISGVGVEFSGVLVRVPLGGSDTGICIENGAQTFLRDLYVEDATSYGVEISNNENSVFDNLFVINSTGHGIYVKENVVNLDIKVCCSKDSSVGSGFYVGSSTSGVKIRGKGTFANTNARYGIEISSGAVQTLVDAEVTIQNNVMGEIADFSSTTAYSGWDHSVSFNGAIWIDTLYGEAGTNYPRGTVSCPVSNIDDALLIAANVGIRRFNVSGIVTLTYSFSRYQFYGTSSIENNIVNLNGQNIEGCYFNRVLLAGASGGGSFNVQECYLSSVTNLVGVAVGSSLLGTCGMGPQGTSFSLGGSYSVSEPTIVDMVGTGRMLGANLVGNTRIINLVSGSAVSLGGSYGTVELDSSCTGGTLLLSGGLYFIGDKFGVAIVDNTIQQAVWNYDITTGTNVNSSAHILRRALGLIHENMIIDNTMYDSYNQLVSCRIRIFANPFDTLAATDGGTPPTDPVPIAEWTQASVWEAQNKLATFKQVRS